MNNLDIIKTSVIWMRLNSKRGQHQGIQIDSKTEGEEMKKALESEKFNNFLKACRWSNFRIEWQMFKYFRKDFWKEFI